MILKAKTLPKHISYNIYKTLEKETETLKRRCTKVGEQSPLAYKIAP